MEKRELTCIGCPMGCALTVELDGGAVVSVRGNTCPRGDAYARKEVTAPTRIVTTTVRVTGGCRFRAGALYCVNCGAWVIYPITSPCRMTFWMSSLSFTSTTLPQRPASRLP